MKKVFLVVFASAAFSFFACKSGEKKTETMDTTEMNDMVDDAMNAVDSMKEMADTTMVDTAKKM